MGILITALVQSSAAVVGILQAFSTTGIISYAIVIPVILGENIGKCTTSIIASISGNKNAKRVAAVHLYFNIIGAILFSVVIYGYQHLFGFSFWNQPADMGGIANFHTLFNVISTIILFTFTKLLEKLAVITIKDNKNDEDANEDDYSVEINKLDDRITSIPSIAIGNTVSVIGRMSEIAEKNFRRSMELLEEFDNKKLERIQERENMIDKMEEKSTKYLVSLGSKNLTKNENASINSLIRINSEIEKIGDYDYRLAKTIEHMNENDIRFSEIAEASIHLMANITEETILKTIELIKTRKLDLATDIFVLKEVAELRREEFKTEHIMRLKQGVCNVDSGISYLEMLTVLEKIIEHCYNTSIALSNYVTNERFITKQDYVRGMYKSKSKIIKDRLHEYTLKYEI